MSDERSLTKLPAGAPTFQRTLPAQTSEGEKPPFNGDDTQPIDLMELKAAIENLPGQPKLVIKKQD